jgi:hypothetical protein
MELTQLDDGVVVELAGDGRDSLGMGGGAYVQ